MKKTRLLVLASLILTMGLVACGGGNSSSQSSTPISSSTENSSSSSSSAPSTSSASESSSTPSSSSSPSSSSIHTHVYGNLIEGYLPSYAYDGMKDHYYCAECGQYFDANKNPVTEESLKLPKYDGSIAISVNGVEKGTFTMLEKEEYVTFVEWEYKNLTVAVDDVLTLTKPGDATYKYKYFGDGNVDKDGKILTAGTVNLTLVGNANGFHLDVSGYKYKGLVVKVNENEYPLTKVSYYEEDKETYIYGYHYFAVGDKMTVVDNVNDIVYDFEDLENDTKWDTFDFHKGDNNEIVFDYEARFGIEFDRGGDKLISITKTFAPNDGSAFQVNYSSDKAAVDLEKMAIDQNNELYDEMSWYLSHEAVINNSDIKDYVTANGFNAYSATISFAKDEMFNLKNVTKNSIIKGEHLASIFSESTGDFVSISGDYLKVLEDATILVFYVPFCDTISLYYIGATATDAYVYFGGSFIPVEINNNIIEYNNFHVDQYDTITFVDDKYSGIEFTLASGYDATVLYASTTSGMTVVMFYKAGTFSASLDLTTHILTVTIIELDGATEVSVPKYLSGKNYLSKTFVDNPENADEVYATGVNVTGTSSDTFYIAFYDANYNGIEDITLDADSSAYGTVMLGKMIYFSQDGTYNVYIHKTTHVVRLVKTA